MSNPPKEFERVIRGIAVNSSGNRRRSTKRLSKKWRVMVALVILGVSGTLLAAYIRSGGVNRVDTQALQLASMNAVRPVPPVHASPPVPQAFSGTALDRLDSKKFDLLRDVFVGVSSDIDAIDALLKEFQRTRAPQEARTAVAQDMVSQLVRARGETRRLVSWARNRDSKRYYSKFGVIPRR